MKYCIGIDIGGTNMKGGLLDLEGKLLYSTVRRLSNEDKGREGIPVAVSELVDALLQEKQIPRGELAGVGLGAPGAIDVAAGVVTRSPNLPEWENFALRESLIAKLGMRVELENDVNAIARGEQWCGAVEGERNFICMALGTGLGGALCMDGKIWRGEYGMAGEIGHINIDPEGVPCNCGSRGCIETFASASALVRRVKEDDFRVVLDSIQSDADIPRRLSELAEEGNAQALAYWEEVGKALGIVTGGLINTLDISLILICGGLSRSLELFKNKMHKTLFDYAYPAIAERVEIRKGKLLEDAGVYGAAANLLFESGILKIK